LPPAVSAALTQAAAVALATLPVLSGLEVTTAQWAVLEGAVAMRIATLAGAASWWPPLHLVFVPGLVLAQGLALPTMVWAFAFVAIAAVFGATFRTQVPLFLTGDCVRARLAELLPPARSVQFVDLGCGLGGVISALKRARPECEFHGVELAPLPFIISRLRAARVGCRVERCDLMAVDLSKYDIAYAFLSPAPMPELWAKARREMRKGSVFASLAFPVPGVAADRVIAASGKARHTLYIYRL
jgi:hypothetical protein